MPILLAPSERTMWEKPVRIPTPKPTDDEINAKYGSRELRIVTESNREQLPNFVDALRRPGWMKLRPSYQRRPKVAARASISFDRIFYHEHSCPPFVRVRIGFGEI